MISGSEYFGNTNLLKGCGSVLSVGCIITDALCLLPLHTIQYNAIHLIAHGISSNLFLLLALSYLVRLHTWTNKSDGHCEGIILENICHFVVLSSSQGCILKYPMQTHDL
jgi:hypothetical protein